VSGPSLIRRVIITQIGVALGAIAILSTILFYQFAQSLTLVTDVRLEDQAAAVRRVLEVDESGAAVRLPRHLAEFYDNPSLDTMYVVLDGDHRIVAASSGVMAPFSEEALASALGGPVYFEFFDASGDQFLGLSERVEVAGLAFTIQVVQGPEHEYVVAGNLIEEFLIDISVIPILVAAALCLVTMPTLLRSLRPLRSLSERAARINPRTSSIRLPEDDLSQELRPLVHAVNGALERLDDGFRAQRQFTADAAHELRTPLAILTAHVDILKDHPQAAQIREDIERMARIVDQLLRIARLDSLPSILETKVDLRALAIETARILGPLAVAKGRTIAVEGARQAVLVKGDPEVLGHALRNLVENALRHTPEGTAVEILVDGGPPPSVCVSDAGPGVPEADRARVFDRFWTKSQAAGGGAGLGLAIVKRAADLHRAEVAVGVAPQGGAAFTIKFQPAR
jgi:signal transduction histidine kinase